MTSGRRVTYEGSGVVLAVFSVGGFPSLCRRTCAAASAVLLSPVLSRRLSVLRQRHMNPAGASLSSASRAEGQSGCIIVFRSRG